MAVTAQADDTRLVISVALDQAFYRAVYPDIVPPISPVNHYALQGWREARDPAAWFSVSDYLATHPDVAQRGVDPFFHFLTEGRHEGREVAPSRHARDYFHAVDWAPPPWSHDGLTITPSAAPETPVAPVAAPAPAPAPGPEPPPLPSDDAIRVAVTAEFDADYYRAVYPDIAASGIDPLDHFLMTGWREGRDPAPGFSTRDYVEAYPDIAASGLNPFGHYVLAGRAEGRLPRHNLGFRYDILAAFRPPAQRIAEATERARALAPSLDAAVLAERLATARNLHITFSHDDYIAHFGGLQLCVRRESARFAAHGADHLHLYPAAAWQVVRAAGEPGPLGVMLNGVELGVFEPAAMARALAMAGPGKARSFAIHSLLGHEPDQTADILAAAGLAAGWFWLHDFASLCMSFHLLRNDVEDCAAPPADSPACGVCAYGPFRARHTEAHRRLFERLELTVVAPSQTTLDFWRTRGDLPAAGAVVVPHATLVDRGAAPKVPARRPFRLAFLGMPVPLKGWPVFRALAERFGDDRRYQFLHLGGRADPATPGAAFHRVVGNEARPLAMQEAVAELEIDAALIWPLCRETFSFTAYEAAAGGAAVLTGPDSGNVAAFVAESGLGRVLADEATLMAAFESGEILALARNRRGARLSDLAYSGLTGELAFA